MLIYAASCVEKLGVELQIFALKFPQNGDSVAAKFAFWMKIF